MLWWTAAAMRRGRLRMAASALALWLWTSAAPVGAAPAFAQPPAESAPPPSADGAAVPERPESMGVAEAAIPEGREDFLAALVGRGETLPGECRFNAGQVNRHELVVTYACAGGELVYAVIHPSKAPPGAAQSKKFALARRGGSPAAGFEDALLERFRAREDGFEWIWPRSAVAPPPRRVPLVPIAAAVSAVLVLWLVRRRRRKAAAR